MTIALRLLVLLCMLLVHPISRADYVAEWNRIALDTVVNSGRPIEYKLHALSMVHVAMFESLNFIQGGYTPHLVVRSPGLDATSSEAAVAAATKHILARLFPEQETALAAAMKNSLDAIPGRRGVAGGVTTGNGIAATVYAVKAPASGTREVTRNRDADLHTVLQKSDTAPRLEPWLVKSVSQFLPSSPAAQRRLLWTQASVRMHAPGVDAGVVPGSSQSPMSRIWSLTIPLAWNPMVAEVVAVRGLRPIESARIHALVSMAISDAHAVTQEGHYSCAWCIATSAMATILAAELGAGIHDAMEVNGEQQVGREIGRYALQRYFRPLAEKR